MTDFGILKTRLNQKKGYYKRRYPLFIRFLRGFKPDLTELKKLGVFGHKENG